MSEEDSPCFECGGMCCSFEEMRINFLPLDKGQRYDSLLLDHSDLDQLLLEDGTIMNARWVVRRFETGERSLAFECHHRTEDGLCGVYDDRPWMCSDFECAAIEGEMTLEELKEEYAETHNRRDWEVVREVTDRVNEILRRKLDAEVRDIDQ